MSFEANDRKELYDWIGRTLRLRSTASLEREGRGLVKSTWPRGRDEPGSGSEADPLLPRGSGGDATSLQAASLHAALHAQRRQITGRNRRGPRDVERAGRRKILEREFHEYGYARYQRPARLSVAQMYRLRKSSTYRKRHLTYQPTKPTQVAIGERRQPDPQGRPGYLRVHYQLKIGKLCLQLLPRRPRFCLRPPSPRIARPTSRNFSLRLSQNRT